MKSKLHIICPKSRPSKTAGVNYYLYVPRTFCGKSQNMDMLAMSRDRAMKEDSDTGFCKTCWKLAKASLHDKAAATVAEDLTQWGLAHIWAGATGGSKSRRKKCIEELLRRARNGSSTRDPR